MSRRWLVVVALCLAGDAAADPAPIAPLACQCPASYILPARDAVVPTNAKIWLFGNTVSRGTLEENLPSAQPDALDAPAYLPKTDHNATFFEPALSPNHRYAFQADIYATAFTVGSEADHEPPAAPDVRALQIAVHPGSSPNSAPGVAKLDLEATFPRDADLVRIVLRRDSGYDDVLYTTPGRLHLCDPPQYDANIVAAWIQSIDLAGNASEPVEVPVLLHATTTGDDPCSEHVHRQGYGFAYRRTGPDLRALGFLIVIIGSIALLAARAIRADGRARADAKKTAQPVSLLVAEPLARHARRMRTIEIAAYFVLMVAGWTVGIYPVAILVIFVALAFDGLLDARRVRKLLDEPQAGAELRGTTLTACAHGTHASIRVSRRAIARAKRHGVPRSIAR